MTLQQALDLKHGDRVHYTANQDCYRTVGPRGGVKVSVIEARVTGKVKTWQLAPTRVEVPVARGLYDHGYITTNSLAQWHLADECPIRA